ncbi:DUF433 domain-containing protein [Candidatus Sumerlaeota bacterium]|nr:DUF433 domain-containing protein [Candidatus Sumerlaeota bacterium]
MEISWREHIESSPDVLHGKPRFKGTRIPVSLILGYLSSGMNNKKILEEFPDLTEEDIAASLDFARYLAELEVAI